MYFVMVDVIDPESGEVVAQAGDNIVMAHEKERLDSLINNCDEYHSYIVDRYEADTVDADSQCPNCHENRIDRLVINDDDSVTCTNCGCTYTL